MKVEIKVPEVGESITDGVLAEWLVEHGSVVRSGQELFELETDKVTMAVPADVGGRLSQDVEAGAVVQVGQVVGAIDTDAAEAPAPSEPAVPDMERQRPAEAEQKQPAAEQKQPAEQPVTPPAGMQQARDKLERGRAGPLAPAARRLVEQHGLDAGAIAGSGKGGRVTKQDVQAHLAARQDAAADAPAAAEQPGAAERDGAAEPAAPQAPDRSRETRQSMSRLRKRITERLVQVQQTAAILTTFNECDMSAVMALRSRHRDRFEKRFDVRLGFMSFFVKAVVDALKTVPQLNARIEGDEIVYQHYYDIGVAVGTEQGLVVPVVREADALGFAAIEKRIGDLARRARERQLTLQELSGGCFTISNGGVYGSLLSTPILNPPQSGILGLHRIQKRPVVVDDEVVVRPMMYLALSYDHRIVDGSEAVTFLKRVVECMEDPERMLLEV
jgi:2-oxoglutarate dehydrogenase E2 component (dihydrolipoamide succinyltransferase)